LRIPFGRLAEGLGGEWTLGGISVAMMSVIKYVLQVVDGMSLDEEEYMKLVCCRFGSQLFPFVDRLNAEGLLVLSQELLCLSVRS
jgi:hypothetical protein